MVAPLKVGIAGLGTVGAEVVRLIENEGKALSARCGRSVRVVGGDRALARRRSAASISRGVTWAKDPVALASDPNIDCFVELMGGSGEPALSAVETALKAGKSVVTANKALIAKHGMRLAQAAEKHGGALNFEAAVGAAIPVIKTLREGLAATGINRVYGILNGTCNYILTRMEQEGLSFAECLKDAQRLGYAEANPSFDVDGHDTAQKLAILASLAFGTKVAAERCLCRRHLLDRARRSARGVRSWLSRQAARRRREDGQGHRAARASDHGAEIILHRTGDGRDQCGHHRRRWHPADHAGRARARAALRRRPPCSPISPTSRAASACSRSAVRSIACAPPRRRRWSGMRAAITSA